MREAEFEVIVLPMGCTEFERDRVAEADGEGVCDRLLVTLGLAVLLAEGVLVDVGVGDIEGVAEGTTKVIN